ncbi:MAG TPA: MFS transporter [Gammaproteobacteria bacterium]
MFAYGASLIDRQILSLMVDPVRADLNLSDTELSLLHGLAFALFYTGFGLPLGWVADHWNRRRLIAIGLSVWGASTVMCGFARSFAGLFGARMAVGMGEAALSPAAYSIIHDYFGPSSRGRAMSVYGVGVFLGAGAAYIIGGAAVEFGAAGAARLADLGLTLRPWQFVFVLVGSLSLVILPFVLSIGEPPRRAAETDAPSVERSNPFSCIGYVWRSGALHGLTILGLSIGAIVFNGLFAWVPSHFIRVFEWSPGEIGLGFGLVLLIFGTAGMWCGGYWSDRAAARGRRDGPITVVLLGEAIGGAAAVVFGFLPGTVGAFAALSVCVFCFGAAIAMGPVALQNVTPAKIRSQMIALYLFVVNVLGLGLGPSLIAGTSDYILRDDMEIGRAVSLVAAFVMPIAAFCLHQARKQYR